MKKEFERLVEHLSGSEFLEIKYTLSNKAGTKFTVEIEKKDNSEYEAKCESEKTTGYPTGIDKTCTTLEDLLTEIYFKTEGMN